MAKIIGITGGIASGKSTVTEFLRKNGFEVVDQISAAELLHECLFGKWNTVEDEMLKIGQERLRELGDN